VVFCTAACAARYAAGLDRRFPDAIARASCTRDVDNGESGNALAGTADVSGASGFPANAAGL
jgi:hypothetical protein